MTGTNTASLEKMKTAIENTLLSLQSWLDEACNAEMKTMVNHHFGWDQGNQGASGKRVRPLLTLLCCQAAGGRWEDALPAAAAVETIHNFSLVHDDIQDQSDTRRGRPTLWAVWGTAQSINTGDSLFVLAHMFLDRMQKDYSSPETILTALQILNNACLELTIGQHLDLTFETRSGVNIDEYYRMIQGKTASLLAASCQIGAVLAGVNENQSLFYQKFGFHLGMAFQLLDDILGIWGDSGETGKPTGADILSRKKTLPVLLGLRDSVDFAAAWSKPSFSQTDMDTMLQLLNNAGVRETTLEEAHRHTNLALESLTCSGASKECKIILSDLAERLLNRQY